MTTAASMPKGSEKNSVESSAASATTPMGDKNSVKIHRVQARMSDWQPQVRTAAAVVGVVLECQHSAVGFGNLTAEHQADARSARLRRKKRHEEIRIVRQAVPLVVDPQLEAPCIALPSDRDIAAGGERRVDGVVQHID